MSLNIAGMFAFDGAAWRQMEENGFRAFDGTAWQIITDGWAFDGTAWQKFWEQGPDPTVDLLQGQQDYDGDTNGFTDNCGCECSVAKKSTCVCLRWNVSDCDGFLHHVEVQREVSGGSWATIADDVACTARAPIGWCRTWQTGYDAGYLASGCVTASYEYRIRVCEDTTHSVYDTSSSVGFFNPASCGAA